MAVLSLESLSALQFPGISLGTHITRKLNRFASSLRHLWHSLTVPEFNTTEITALTAAWHIVTIEVRIAKTLPRQMLHAFISFQSLHP